MEAFLDTATIIRSPTPGHISSIAAQILSAKTIVILQGAGVSVASGIPDYRSANGLFSWLASRNINMTPEQALSIDTFRKTPDVYHAIERNFFLGSGPYLGSHGEPSEYQPNQGHLLARHIFDRSKLLRVYTQNVDGLQAKVIPDYKLVEFHGTRRTASCIDEQCKVPMDISEYIAQVKANKIPRCSLCNDLVKCDIVLYGEKTSEASFAQGIQDLRAADLVIVMGTSLEVHPFKTLLDFCFSPVIVFNKVIPATYPGYLMPRTTFVLADMENVCGEINQKLKVEPSEG